MWYSLWRLIGVAAIHLNLLRLAAVCFHRVLARCPNDAESLTYLAWTSAQLGELEQSLNFYERLIGVRPDSSEGYLGAASSLQHLQRHEDAIAYYTQGIDREPANQLLRYNRASSLAAVGRTEEAIADYRRVIRANPSDAQALGNLAAALGVLRRWEEAVNFAERAMAAAPSATHACNLGITLLELGRYAEAELAFRRGLKFDPSSTEMHLRLALALSYRQKHVEAVHLLRVVTSTNPDTVDGMSTMVAVLTLHGDFDEAVRVAEQFVERWPDLPLAHETLGWAYLKRGYAHKSLAAYDRAISGDPHNVELHAGRGAALSLANRHAEALQAFNVALDMAPTCLSAYPEFGEAFERSRAAMLDR
jgi:tetratricopeptide (TPR) repeat protein